MSDREERDGKPQGGWWAVVVAWVLVLAPLAWGVLATAQKARQLFLP
jgi:hypothetical protein